MLRIIYVVIVIPDNFAIIVDCGGVSTLDPGVRIR